MRTVLNLLLVAVMTAVFGCSLAPDKPVTRQELYRTNLFSQFTIKDSPESILATLNREGEVIVEGKSKFGDDYYIKLLATNQGIRIRLYAK